MILVSLALLLGAILTSGATIGTETTNATTSQMEPKIVGGSSVSISSFPYTVSIRLTATDRKSYGSGHLCGGVVISQRLVATAAHCTYNSNTKKYRTAGEYFLVMGSTYLKTRTSNTLEYYVQQLVIHPSYNHDSLTNDIALMFINGYIPWNSYEVKALPLNSAALVAGTQCYISGWGLLQDGGTSTSNTLQAAIVPIVAHSVCAQSYQPLPDSQVCAGLTKGGVDACQGDSGGPMACNGVLAGVVSYGYGCAQPGYPGVYTNITFYRSWIVQQNSSFDYTVFRNAGIRQGTGSILLIVLAIVLTAWTRGL
ncbi:hypothetical protein KR074_008834 [Drosophila pseudoananassae]|nr:hypothetical protein KR074_008834 [Drosophila pseudoananassae]